MKSHKEMNEYGKVIKCTQLFFLWAMHFGKRTFETLVYKIIGIKLFELLSKDNI